MGRTGCHEQGIKFFLHELGIWGTLAETKEEAEFWKALETMVFQGGETGDCSQVGYSWGRFVDFFKNF